jgi:hypothetical protein
MLSLNGCRESVAQTHPISTGCRDVLLHVEKYVHGLRVPPDLSENVVVFLNILGMLSAYYGCILDPTALNMDVVFLNTFEEFVDILQDASCS